MLYQGIDVHKTVEFTKGPNSHLQVESVESYTGNTSALDI
jgi:hypothetical protein